MLSKQNSSIIAQEILPQFKLSEEVLQRVCTNHYSIDKQTKKNTVSQIGSY